MFDSATNDELWKAVAERDTRIAELEKHIRGMHEADERYGSGFYNDAVWLTHYRALRSLIGMRPSDSEMKSVWNSAALDVSDSVSAGGSHGSDVA